MKGLTWADLAAHYGMDWCPGCDEAGAWDHDRGEYEVFRHSGPSGGSDTIHWADRRMTRANLRRFLVLVYRIRHYHLNLTQPLWWIIWRSNVFAYHEALALHVKLPVAASEEDRLRVAALIVAARHPHPDKEKARRWAYASQSMYTPLARHLS